MSATATISGHLPTISENRQQKTMAKLRRARMAVIEESKSAASLIEFMGKMSAIAVLIWGFVGFVRKTYAASKLSDQLEDLKQASGLAQTRDDWLVGDYWWQAIGDLLIAFAIAAGALAVSRFMAHSLACRVLRLEGDATK